MPDLNELLRCYSETGSEEAFRNIVELSLSLVYSTALRQANGDAALAADIAQTVFTDFARKAAAIPRDTVVAGWLYRHTCFISAKAIRAEHRRQAREQEAVRMSNLNEPADAAWTKLAPVLDDAMARLNPCERDAVVLRFFEGKDFRTVGLALGISDDAAQKRISRALEKLRRLLQREGVAISATALSAALGTIQVSSAVPAGLATVIAAGALSGAATTGPGIALLTAKLLGMTKIQLLSMGAVMVAGISIPVLVQQQSLGRLRAENAELKRQLANSATEVGKIALSDAAASQAENERLLKEHSELLRLRAESARLRAQQIDLLKVQEENTRLRASSGNTKDKNLPGTGVFVPTETWANVGLNSPLDSLQTAHWAVHNGDIQKFKDSILVTDAAKQMLNGLLAKMAPDALEQAKKLGFGVEEGIMFPMMAKDRNLGFKGYRILSQETPSESEVIMNVELELNSGATQQQNMRYQRIEQNWKHVIDVADVQEMEKKEGKK